MTGIETFWENILSISFQEPRAFYLLLAIPLIWLFFWYLFRKANKTLELLRQKRRVSAKRYFVSAVLWSLMVASLVAIAATPQIVEYMPERGEPKRNCIFLVDTSRSMSAWDEELEKTNIQIAGDVGWEVLRGIAPARCQIFAYAEFFLDISEFEDDYESLRKTFKHSLYTEPRGTIPAPGSDLPNALERMARWMEHDEYRDVSHIILISDGSISSDQGSRLSRALSTYERKGLSIVTLGVGSVHGQRIPLFNSRGEIRDYVKDRNGIKIVYLQEDNMKKIASRTGGNYFHHSEKDALVEYLLNLDSKSTVAPSKGEVLSSEDFSWIFLVTFTISFAAFLMWRKELY